MKNDQVIESKQELSKVMTPQEWEDFGKNLAEMMVLLKPVLVGIGKKIGEVLEVLKPVGKAIIGFMENWSEFRKKNAIFMAQNGWFPNWITFYNSVENDVGKLNTFMIDSIDNNIDEITNTFVELYPHRKHIIEEAFNLHKQGNFIASVPLFIIQADGICHEAYSPFFAKGRERKGDAKIASEKIMELVDSGELSLDFLALMLLEPLKFKPQISQPSSHHHESYKERGPNRHGIIHGSRHHLDYGTKINSYKAISFMAFIATLAHKKLRDQLLTRNFPYKTDQTKQVFN